MWPTFLMHPEEEDPTYLKTFNAKKGAELPAVKVGGFKMIFCSAGLEP